MKKLIFVLLTVFCLVGCGANVNSTEIGTEENMTVHYEAMDGVQSYKFAKPDGDYSEIKVSKELNVTSEQVAQTFNNFWTFTKTDKKIDKDAEVLEEDVLTYKDRTCNYIIYKNGLAAYSDTNGNSEVLAWKSNYVK